ncbi:MAG: phenylacetic acid degradation protein PaaN [Steroidobacteraceae bacterium]
MSACVPVRHGIDHERIAALAARHAPRLAQARDACRTRRAWSPFAEQPASYPDHEAARSAGRSAFNARLGREYDLQQPGVLDWVGEEVSPYTQEPLGCRYARCDLDALFGAAAGTVPAWAALAPEARAALLMEVLDRIYQRRLFELAEAVMHTAGQSSGMAFAGSGVNALDRGIEALVYAVEAMAAVAAEAIWDRPFGSTPIRLLKRYRLVPRGVAVCFTCASFPTWNAYPSMIASLATGNAVIVKPHPATVLPMAISVEVFREVLGECGLDPDLVLLAPDTTAEPVGKRIIAHRGCAIVDFTGSARFGQWVERNAHPALVYTETAGCNAVVLESCDDLDAVLRSLATTLCLFSAQMCTSPQNIYLPANGVRVGRGAGSRLVPCDEVARQLAAAVGSIGAEPRKAAAILATIQAPATLQLIAALAAQARARGALLLEPAAYRHPEFPRARTSTPLMIAATPADRELYAEERFGPISFVIRCADAADALRRATDDVHTAGGLTAFVYSTDPRFIDAAEDGFARAGAQLTLNLTGPMPPNFAAAYSDYHVTGLNPAGNASLTDLAFVASRFRIAQSRRPGQCSHEGARFTAPGDRGAPAGVRRPHAAGLRAGTRHGCVSCRHRRRLPDAQCAHGRGSRAVDGHDPRRRRGGARRAGSRSAARRRDRRALVRESRDPFDQHAPAGRSRAGGALPAADRRDGAGRSQARHGRRARLWRHRDRRRGQHDARAQGDRGRRRWTRLHRRRGRRPHGPPLAVRVHRGGARGVRRPGRGRWWHLRWPRPRRGDRRGRRLRLHGDAVHPGRGEPRGARIQADGGRFDDRRPGRERGRHRHAVLVAEAEPAGRRHGSGPHARQAAAQLRRQQRSAGRWRDIWAAGQGWAPAAASNRSPGSSRSSRPNIAAHSLRWRRARRAATRGVLARAAASDRS